MSESPSSLVERMLAERIGLDPATVGEALIARGVHARMTALGLRTKAEYDRTLLDRSDEVQALVEEVVVPESWFFRDDRPFEALDEFARNGWLADPHRQPLRALSIPCAGGEEPYSIAMTLLEAGLARERFRVDAVDVSARSLARAIAGVYGPNAFRGRASEARSSYFREHNGAFAIEPSVRSCVRFHLGNLLDPALFADGPPFDVVFCRNLLIYLDDEANARAFATLDRLLADDGLLFLGHADRLDDPEGTPFRPTADKGAFAFRKVEAKPSISPHPLGEAPGVRGMASPASRKNGLGGLHPVVPKTEPRPPERKPAAGRAGQALPITHDRQGKPCPTGNHAPAPITPAESPASILERASKLADLGRYNEAIAVVETLIRGGGAGAPAYFLLGLIAQAAGHRDRAEGHYLKAIYLDPQHDEALLSLALLARRKGDIASEAAYRKRADRVLARKAEAAP
jgi:chemotaxis protein methyltransferase WspC